MQRWRPEAVAKLRFEGHPEPPPPRTLVAWVSVFADHPQNTGRGSGEAPRGPRVQRSG